MSIAEVSPPSSYRIAEFEDPAAELERLRLQAAIIFAQEDAVLRELGFPDAGRVLEAGCGPGFVAAALMGHRPQLEIVGVDVDREALRSAMPRTRVLIGTALALPFADARFDAAYARLMLRHVAAPERAVAELVRVVRPGGRVFAIDADDGQLVLDPVPDELLRVQEARHASIRRRGCDPYTARRIPGLFVRAGLRHVQARGIALSSTALGREAFARTVLFPITQAIDEDLVPTAVVARCEDALRVWCRDEAAFGMIVATVVMGEVAGPEPR